MRTPAPLQPGRSGPPLWAGILPLLLALVVLAGAQPSGYPRAADIAAAILAVTGVVIMTARIVRRR